MGKGFFTKIFRRKHHGGDEKKPKKSKKSGNVPNKLKDDPASESATDKQPSPSQISERADPRTTPTSSLVPPRHKDMVSPRSNGSGRRSQAPVDLDDTDEEESRNKSVSPTNGLTEKQLRQYDRQQPNGGHNSPYVHSPTHDPRLIGIMTEGQMAAMEDMENRSDCSSSDFNLSTDAEDTEYNNLRHGRGGSKPYLNTSNLDTSGISQMSSPTAYTTDDDNAIFPALQTDDDATAKDESGPAPDDEVNKIVPMAHETEEDMRAWTISPTSQSSKKSSNSGFKKSTTPKGLEIEAPKKKQQQQQHADAFGDFANFDNVSFPMEGPSSSRSSHRQRPFLVDGPDKSPDFHRTSRHHRGGVSSSASAAHPDTSLTDLLAQAKRKSTRNKRGSSSVNSAPVITAQYLREHHKLGSHRSDTRSSSEKTTSVSDIIQNLEASRVKSSSRRSRDYETRSHASNGNSTTRSAKERLREKRRMERNRAIGSDDSDNEEAEPWLFDQVTGALGPRGVAADMESLGGRSKSSSGNKSHRSHRSHKSHRSHRSSRRKKSSNESVDSRNSRYSHRSTRSYLSQMSEQSRSVANDLLRLEMQLAMVGSQEQQNQEDKGSVTGGSIASRQSRNSRKSSSHRRSSTSVSRRSKMTVVAPPGKLGIILANKADSKGTVVSGVRTSSVLAEKISPGDRIIAIDGEDVSLMTVSEITTIMARKSDFERQLTVMTVPKHLSSSSSSRTTEPDGYYRRN